MGGHGALTIALKNPGRYKSATAFSPICSPLDCPWGEKALGNYLGPDRSAWAEYDTTALVAASEEQLPVLVDGDTDRILGASILGPGGDEIVNMFAAYMYSGLPCSEYRRSVLVHPTISELMPWILDTLEPV